MVRCRCGSLSQTTTSCCAKAWSACSPPSPTSRSLRPSATYDGLLAAVAAHRPDAVLADIRMPPTHTDEGVRAALTIRADHPATGVVLLSQHASPSYAFALLGGTTTGIGYLLKDRVSDVGQLAGALRTVATGGSVVDPLVIQELIAARRVLADSPLAALTEREQEVLAAMAEGLATPRSPPAHTRPSAPWRSTSPRSSPSSSWPTSPTRNRRVKAVLVYLTELSR